MSTAEPTDGSPTSWRGRSLPRVEDRRVLSARTRYLDDLAPDGMLHAAFLRSQYAHARLRSVDTAAANRCPGVELVMTAADLSEIPDLTSIGPPGFFAPSFSALTGDKARYVGDPIAVVVARSRAIAEDALALIEVDYEPLAAAVTIADAVADDSPAIWDDHGSNVVWQKRWSYGEDRVDDGLRRLRATFTSPSVTNAPLECRGTLASYEPSTGQMTVHAGTQSPGRLGQAIAHHLGLESGRVRVVVPDVGGSFGQKGWFRPEDIVVAEASRRLGRPVKWAEDRTESLMTGGKARDEVVEAEVGYDDDGVVRELAVHLSLSQGAYPLAMSRAMLVGQIRTLFPSAYRLARFTFEATVVATNTPTYLPYRGPWSAETWVRERLLDMVAVERGIDPVEMRRRNLVGPHEQTDMLTGPPLRDIQLIPALDRAAQLLDIPALRAEQALADSSRALGVGIACYLEPAPGPPEFLHAVTGVAGQRAHTVQVRLERSGELVVWAGQAPHGQSHLTTFSQIAADGLGIDPGRVRVVVGDTAEPPFEQYATGGSAAAHMVTGAIDGATAELRRRLIERAAEVLEASPDDIVLRDGRCAVVGSPGSQITLQELASTPSTAVGVGRPSNGLELTFRYENTSCGWSQGVHAAVVEVDLRTGLVHFRRYLVVEACGPAINPAIVDGQIRGGVAQGIGSVLYECSAFDDIGNPVATTLMDYLLPTSTEVPTVEIDHLVADGAADRSGYRGVGEGGTIGATSATMNAIADALRSRGAEITERYLPPSRLLELAGIIDP